MRDEEKIDMYYKYGLLDWKTEQELQMMKKGDSIKESIFPWEILATLWTRVTRRYKRVD